MVNICFPRKLYIIIGALWFQDFPQSDVTRASECSEDFVNISINSHQGAKNSQSLPLTPSPSSSPQKRMLDLVNTSLGKGKNLLKGRLKSNTVNEPPTSLQPMERSSPQPIRRNLSDKSLSQLGTSPVGTFALEDLDLKARCQSDASSIKVGC